MATLLHLQFLQNLDTNATKEIVVAPPAYVMKELYAHDPMATLHSGMNQLQNIQQAKQNIQDTYNHKRHLANQPPIDFPTSKTV